MSDNSESKTRQRPNRTKDIIQAQAQEAIAVTQEAAKSGAYLYPVKGIYYLLAHPRLYKPLAKPLFLSFLTSIGVLGFLFAFTYLPQAAFLSIFSGPLGFITAIPLILGEASAITLTIAKIFYLGPALEDLFDETLLLQGQTELVSRGREVTDGHQGHGKAMGALVMKPLNRFSKENLIRYLLSAPLNLIPIVGTVFFLGYNGAKSGPANHSRYFQLRSFTPEQKKQFVSERRGAYTSFGFAALAMGLIPFAGLGIACSNSVGAALWAADEERRRGKQTDIDAVPEQDRKADGGVRELSEL